MNKDLRLSSAIHILVALHFKGKTMDSKKLAMSLQTNPAVIRRIIAQLARAGIVHTEKGKGGGSQLAMVPKKITLETVFLALGDHRIFKSFDKKPFEKCHVSCCMKGTLDKLYIDLEKSLLSHMKRITLHDIIDDIKIEKH